MRAALPICAAALAAALTLLSGCASVQPRPTAPVTLWTQRAEQLRNLNQFVLHGRIAASNGQDGFSAGIQWRQQGEDASIALAAPLGFGAAQIEQRGQALTVTTSRGEVLSDEAAMDQLTATLGFAPPLMSLRY